MEKFHFVFDGSQDANLKDWDCKLTISGAPEKIGQLLAAYARAEAAAGQYDPIKVLITAFEILKKDATVERNGIIRPFA